MTNRLLHTPEGVRDIYGDELRRKKSLEDKLNSLVRSYGYNEIDTPSFEYFDIFAGERGTTPSKEIYKFFDSENNTLALRPDFTPGVARAAVKYFLDEGRPVRLSYLGQTFSNLTDLQGKLKEVTELGLEYMGEPSVDADAEMICLTVKLLQTAGLKDFQICIGNVEYFRGLCEYAGLKGETEEELLLNIRNKNYFGTMDVLNDADISDEIRDTLYSFSDFFGNIEVLSEAEKKVVDIPRSLNAVNTLKTLYEKLMTYGVEKYISFDLGMLSKHDYYTGVIFRAYTFGTGDAIVRGGRYDNLLKSYGKDAAATGFTVVIDKLMNVLDRQHIELSPGNKKALVLYTEDSFEDAVKKASALRAEGTDTEMTRVASKDETEKYRGGAAQVCFITGGREEVIG